MLKAIKQTVFAFLFILTALYAYEMSKPANVEMLRVSAISMLTSVEERNAADALATESIAMKERVSLLTAHVNALQEENSDLTIALNIENERNALLTRRINNAMVIEGSVSELYQNRLEPTVNKGMGAAKAGVEKIETGFHKAAAWLKDVAK